MAKGFHLNITEEQLYYLESCSRIRECSRTQLVQRLMNTICNDRMVLSILDDESKPIEGARRFHRKAVFGNYSPP